LYSEKKINKTILFYLEKEEKPERGEGQYI
jgi:hypothetical protein